MVTRQMTNDRVALLSTLSIVATVVIYYAGSWFDIDSFPYLIGLFPGAAAITIVVLLVRVFLLVRELESWGRGVQRHMRAHILLHLVPASYLALHYFAAPTLLRNVFYLAPVLLFFFTGRQTWQAFYRHFGAPVYRIFFAGNTGMMVGHVVLICLGVLYESRFGAEIFQRALTAYFIIHLLALGFAVVKIEKDLRSQTPRELIANAGS